jgi:cyclophilin family peptidyl-prolyl cis-trans isomerase
MKSASGVRRSRIFRDAQSGHIKALEARTLLSATLSSAFSPQSLVASQAVTVPLTSHFDDPSLTPGDTVVDIQTNLPAPANQIPLQVTNAATPLTVAFFLKYISSGEFSGTLLNRLATGFVLQGGTYTVSGSQITSLGTVPDESSTEVLKNTAGTIADALAGGPGTATSSFFFNLADNRSLLDGNQDGGPYTAFGKVIYAGMSALNAINKLPVVDDVSNSGWNSLPVQNYTGSSGDIVSSVPPSDYITINPVVVPGGLNYSVTSSNSSIVKSVVTNGSLSLTGESAGTATVTVTATDLGGGKASAKFSVTVLKPTAISGKVLSDNNGEVNPGEPGLAGAKVFIDANKNGKLDPGETSTTTNSSGTYTFTGLSAGIYQIAEVLPSGYKLTSPSAGFYSIKATAGATVTVSNFVDTPAPATISGRVFADPGGTGQFKSGDPGLGLWTVYIDLNHDGTLDAGDIQTTTDIYGDWSFTNLAPGTYDIRIVPVTGLKTTTPAELVVAVEAGVTVVGELFGEQAIN